jgi:hypothetical protein
MDCRADARLGTLAVMCPFVKNPAGTSPSELLISIEIDKTSSVGWIALFVLLAIGWMLTRRYAS